MPLYHPHDTFVRRLKEYDPMLRVRWSDYARSWQLERKMRHGKSSYGNSPNPDVNRRYQDGYVHVFSIPYEWLDGRVFKALDLADLWKMGGAKALNRRMDQEIEAKEERDARNQKDDLRYVANDMFTAMQYRGGSRVGYGGRLGN